MEEGNGGVILRESHLGRDSLVAATLVLNRMSQSDIAISAVHNTLPSFEIVKDKISVDGIDFQEIIEKINFQFKDESLEKLMGISFLGMTSGYISGNLIPNQLSVFMPKHKSRNMRQIWLKK